MLECQRQGCSGFAMLGWLKLRLGGRPGVVDLAIRFAADGSRTMRRFRSHQRLQVTLQMPRPFRWICCL